MKRGHASNGMPSQRQLRVGEIIRHALSEILARGEVSDPEIEGKVITVPEVRMSPDLKNATCFIIGLGEQDQEALVKVLARNAKYLRGEVARRVSLKFIPALRFRVDTSFETAQAIDDLLKSPQVARDLERPSNDNAD